MEKPYEAALRDLNAKLWEYSELKFEEHRSAKAITELFQKEGFQVQTGLGGIQTAFSARFGAGGPVIGILGEYDALSGLSQEADVTHHQERPETKNGQGCGHCQLGTASAGAALQVRDYLKDSGQPGTVIFFGCPAEEGGSAKAFMARDGVFDCLDAALTWHPYNTNMVMTGSYQANCQAYFAFSGVSAHAAACPHLGRSALDAVELMDIGANYLREHMEPTDRLHYAILDTGGVSPNVVQSKAKVVYLVRSTDSQKAQKLYARVCKIAQGAAMMTETELEITFDKACSNVISNSVLEQLLYDKMVETGVPSYTEADRAYAEKFAATITEADLDSDPAAQLLPAAKAKQLVKRLRENPIADFVLEHQHLDIPIPGSSDVGDVSHVVPTAQFTTACAVAGTPAHSWQRVAQGKSELAVKGLLYAADILAAAAVECLKNPALLAKAKAEFIEVTNGGAYQSPIPADVLPNGGRK